MVRMPLPAPCSTANTAAAGAPRQQQRRRAQRVGQRGQPRRQQRVHAAQQAELQQPRRPPAPGPTSAPTATAAASVAPAGLQQPRQVRGHRGADEPGGGEHEGQQHASAWQTARRSSVGVRPASLRPRAPACGDPAAQPARGSQAFSGSPSSRCSAAQAKQAPRQPICDFQQRRQRPAHGAGKAGDQRDAGDRVARLRAVQPHQRREGRLVQAAAHGHADQRPGGEQRRRALRQAQRHQAGGEHQVGAHQHRPAAVAVDGAARPGPEQGRHHQRHREGRKHRRRGTPRSRAIGAASIAGR